MLAASSLLRTFVLVFNKIIYFRTNSRRAVNRLDFVDTNTNTDMLIMIPILNDTDTDLVTTKYQHIL